jgi:hypothetical protein
MNSCPKCSYVIVDNNQTLTVLKLLRMRKREGKDKKFPLLVADFYCKKCKNSIHVKWVDLDKDLKVLNCSECGENLYSTVFLGVMNGFMLESYCCNCLSKLNSGSVGYQK